MSIAEAPPPVRTISADHLPSEAIGDLLDGLRHHEIWTSFALHEIRQRFRRSILRLRPPQSR